MRSDAQGAGQYIAGSSCEKVFPFLWGLDNFTISLRVKVFLFRWGLDNLTSCVIFANKNKLIKTGDFPSLEMI